MLLSLRPAVLRVIHRLAYGEAHHSGASDLSCAGSSIRAKDNSLALNSFSGLSSSIAPGHISFDECPSHLETARGYAAVASAATEAVPGGERRSTAAVAEATLTRARASDSDLSFRAEWQQHGSSKSHAASRLHHGRVAAMVRNARARLPYSRDSTGSSQIDGVPSTQASAPSVPDAAAPTETISSEGSAVGPAGAEPELQSADTTGSATQAPSPAAAGSEPRGSSSSASSSDADGGGASAHPDALARQGGPSDALAASGGAAHAVSSTQADAPATTEPDEPTLLVRRQSQYRLSASGQVRAAAACAFLTALPAPGSSWVLAVRREATVPLHEARLASPGTDPMAAWPLSDSA